MPATTDAHQLVSDEGSSSIVRRGCPQLIKSYVVRKKADSHSIGSMRAIAASGGGRMPAQARVQAKGQVTYLTARPRRSKAAARRKCFGVHEPPPRA